ncbi:ATP synthase subunit E [Oscillospiraceae bacterium]|nr:ATP synthase subunit E [Oscillospiraceae bacterium]BDF76726.1 ATP synthase subunit E [Oscillospiraceae bacterium]
MNGIDKITGKIAQDVQEEIDALLDGARRDAAEIAARYDAMAQKESEDILARGRRSAEERVERLASVAQLEARKLILGAKQEALSAAFDKALDDLLNLPEAQYVALLANLCARAARTGREEVIFSQKDRTRYGKQVVTQANEILARQVAPKLPGELAGSKAGALLDKVVTGASALLAGTGMLTLAEESRPIKGGLILSDGDVEVNCTFETLVRLQRDEMASEVAKVLFD